MSFSISKVQQKVFVDEFMAKILSLSFDLLEKGNAKPSPGETIRFVAEAVINEINRIGDVQTPPPEELN